MDTVINRTITELGSRITINNSKLVVLFLQ
jgi:hypothetical protein